MTDQDARGLAAKRDISKPAKKTPNKEETDQEWTDLIATLLDGFDPEGSDDESKFDQRFLYEVTGICDSIFDLNDSFDDENDARVQRP